MTNSVMYMDYFGLCITYGSISKSSYDPLANCALAPNEFCSFQNLAIAAKAETYVVDVEVNRNTDTTFSLPFVDRTRTPLLALSFFI